MPRRLRTPLIPTLLITACLGAGGGALAYAAFSSNDGTRTVIRQVTVKGSQPTSNVTPLSVNDIYRRAYKGVVEITVSSQSSGFPFGNSQKQRSEGSGFVYDAKGDILTNQHVVDGAKSISVRFWNGKTYKGKLVGSDRSTDLAVVRVSAPASELDPLSLGDSSKLLVGDGVVAIGSPFGLEGTVTSGIVSALHRVMTSPSQFTIQDSIQTDAAINHGNSGGPLLNGQGQVVGVTSQIESNSGGSDGIGFAIPSNTVRSVAGQLIANGKAEHAYLGVSVDSNAENARVASVRAGTPAAKAGLRAGDVVTAVGSTKVSRADDLSRAIDARKPGDRVTITYKRGGSTHTVQLRFATRPS
jgi:putative serine protease PepD